jgi:TetR/AcrR family transcriptional repressor of nem operon
MTATIETVKDQTRALAQHSEAMGHSQAEKARSRERILKQAAEQIRERGLDSLSVSKLMRSVDLTHGGFYGHFASRSELLAQALERALCEGATAARMAGSATPADFASWVRRYLSRQHRDSPGTGCALAALSCDVARAEEHLREVMSAHLEQYVARLAATLDDEDDDKALFAASAMIGALLVSRVLTDPARSEAVLAAARTHLIALASGDPGGTAGTPFGPAAHSSDPASSRSPLPADATAGGPIATPQGTRSAG